MTEISTLREAHNASELDRQKTQRAVQSQLKSVREAMEQTRETQSRVRDSLRTMQGTQARHAEEISNLRSELQTAKLESEQRTSELGERLSKSVEELKELYLKMLPFVQRVFVEDKRREAIDAMGTLSRSHASELATGSTARRVQSTMPAGAPRTPASIATPVPHLSTRLPDSSGMRESHDAATLLRKWSTPSS